MRRSKIFLIVLGVLWAWTARVAAMDAPASHDADGFSAARTIETKYFTLYLADGVDEAGLRQALDIGPEHKILAGQSLSRNSADHLGGAVDALFGWTGGILDMQLVNYKGVIKVSRDEEEIKLMTEKLYGHEVFSDKALYVYDFNTIYIAAPDFTKEILGHEMGHAIICHYFVVQPPEKVQEVLAGYIEYQLRKISKP